MTDKLRIAILHQAVPPGASLDEQDVLMEVEAVSNCLKHLGHHCRLFACTLNLERLERSLTRFKPDLAFNLVESLGGTDRLACLVPTLLEARRIPHTGASALAITLTANKVESKKVMRRLGIPTAPCWSSGPDDAAVNDTADSDLFALGDRFIVKPIGEHASVGMDDSWVIQAADLPSLALQVRQIESGFGRPLFAEAFIDGREFNLSILQSAAGPRVFPAAEIDFSEFPPGKPRIVGYAAKWVEDSFEYRHTDRTFNFAASDHLLLARLQQIAQDCWHGFGLTGYARVDFRVDAKGQPYVLELNANPCITPEGGFHSAAMQAGLNYETMLTAIVQAAAASPLPVNQA